MFRSVTTPERMEEKIATKNFAGNKDASRTILDKYYSVQFSLNKKEQPTRICNKIFFKTKSSFKSF